MDPAIKLQREEARLCECGAAGSGEGVVSQFEITVPWQPKMVNLGYCYFRYYGENATKYATQQEVHIMTRKRGNDG